MTGSAVSVAQDWVGVQVSLETAAVNAPQIKKEEYKDYRIEGEDAFLILHAITEYNIHGKIVQYTEYTTDTGGIACLSTLKIIKYDKGGNRIGIMRYNSGHALVWSEEFMFDQLGRKIKVVQTSYEEAATLSKVTRYQYDSKGNVSTINTFDSNEELIAEYKRNYNTSGELASITAWSYVKVPDNVKPVKRNIHTTYEYDTRGNLKLSETEVTEGKTKWKDTRYFENNFVVEWTSYKNGELQSHYKKSNNLIPDSEEDYNLPPPIPYQELPMEYDDRKRDPLQNISHSSMRTVTVKNNDLGNPIKEVVREQQQVVTVTYFYYDNEHKLSREKKIYKLENKIDETHFEYDDYANLLKETTFRSDKKIAERVFQYEFYP